MSKDFIKFSILFVFLSGVLVGCANAQTIDSPPDQIVLEQFEKLKDKKFGKDDVCIERLKESAKIIVIGLFANDSGCRLDGVFVDSLYFETSKLETSKHALAALGWEKANRQKREKLVILWVEKVLFAFSAKPNQTFRAVSTTDGGIKVIVSLEYPPGVTSRNAPKIFVFDKDGGLSPASGN